MKGKEGVTLKLGLSVSFTLTFVFVFLTWFPQLCAELKQVQTKLIQVEQSLQSQAADCEHQQHKIRELELELARNSTTRSAATSLQEELQSERARLIAADKKVRG